MDDILNNFCTLIASQIAADCSGFGNGGIGNTGKFSKAFDNSITFCDERNERTRHHKFNEWFKKWLSLMLGIMLEQQCAICLQHSERYNFVTFMLNAGDHFAG